MPTAGAKGEGQHWVGYTYFALGLFRFPSFVYGPVAEGVDHVEVLFSRGESLRTKPVVGPDEVNPSINFYVAELPHGSFVRAILARDRSGTILERRVVKVPSFVQAHDGG